MVSVCHAAGCFSALMSSSIFLVFRYRRYRADLRLRRDERGGRGRRDSDAPAISRFKHHSANATAYPFVVQAALSLRSTSPISDPLPSTISAKPCPVAWRRLTPYG